MNVSDLTKFQQIDREIQRLLSDLAELYKAREEAFGGTAKPAKTRKKATVKSLDKIDFTQFDLSI